MDEHKAAESTGGGPANAAPSVAVTTARIESIRNARRPEQEQILHRAANILNTAIGNARFFERVREASYVRTGWKSSSGRRVSYTREQIADRIAAGRERNTPIDNVINMEIALQVTEPGTYGSATLGHQPIRPGYWFVDECIRKDKAGPLAGHLMHEWLHVSGFYHKYRGPQADVPYVVGRIIRDMLQGQFVDEDDDELWAVLEEGDCGCHEEDDAREEAVEERELPDE